MCCSHASYESFQEVNGGKTAVFMGSGLLAQTAFHLHQRLTERGRSLERKLACFLKGYLVTLEWGQASSPMMESIYWVEFSGHFLRTPPVTQFQSSAFRPGES